MSTATDQTLRHLLCIRLRAGAGLNMQVAASLIGKGQEELRQHFSRNGELMIEAIAELERPRFGPDVLMRASDAIRERYYAGGNVVQLTSVKPVELAQLVLESAGIRVEGVEPLL